MTALDRKERERRERLIAANTRGALGEIAKRLPKGYICSAVAEPSVPGQILIFKDGASPSGEAGRVYVTFNCCDMSVKNIRSRMESAPACVLAGKIDEAWAGRVFDMKGITDMVCRVFYGEGLIKTPPPVADGVMRGMEMAEAETAASDFKALTNALAENLPEDVTVVKVVAEPNPKGLSWHFTHRRLGLLGFIRMIFLDSKEEILAFFNKTDDIYAGEDKAAVLFDDDGPPNGPADCKRDKFSLINMYSNKDDGYMRDRQGLMTEIGKIMDRAVAGKTLSGIQNLREFGIPQKSINMASDFYEDRQAFQQEVRKKIPPEKVAEAERAIMEHLRGPYSRMARGMSHLSDWVRINASVHVQESRVTYTFIHEGMGELGRADVTLDGPVMAVSALSYGIGRSGDGRDPEREELMREISVIAKAAFGATES
jgi:hypothetical protein